MKNNFFVQNAMRLAIEFFLINHFDSTELSGSVRSSGKDGINYFGIDLKMHQWDKNVEALNAELSKYMTGWAKKYSRYFDSYVTMSHITVEYLLPEENNTNMNISKNIQLYHLPAYYYRTHDGDRRIKGKFAKWFSIQWNDYFRRNTVIVVFLTIILMFCTFFFYYHHPNKIFDIGKLVEYTNLASSIMASFLLTFLITKVIAIKQHKMSKGAEIKELSVKLTYFRKLCLNLRTDFNYWKQDNPYIKSYNHGIAIMHKIAFEDYFYPDHTSEQRYAYFRGLYRDDVSHPIVCLILQLYLFSDEDYFHQSNLTYTDYPSNYIYTLKEMERFSILMENNTIWYACDEKYFPDTFPETYQSKEIMQEIARIHEEFKDKPMTSAALRKVSLDFQYDIIPKLYRLVKLTEKPLPESIMYFMSTAMCLLFIGIVVPSILFIFLGTTVWSAISACVMLGFILHILLCLPFLFKEENELDRNLDYI